VFIVINIYFNYIGLSVGDARPNFESFLNPIVISLKKLELGTNISFKDMCKEIKFYLTHAVMDKPAKSAMLNMVTRTGFFGCTKCLQSGKSLKKTIDGKT
jgi:hypothetical protein